MGQQYLVALPEDERAALQTLIGSGTAPARILLKTNQGAAGPGWTDALIAGAVEVPPTTVARVRQTYVTEGLTAALYRQPPARAYHRTLDGAQAAQLIALTGGSPPEGRACGTVRWLVRELVRLTVGATVSHETVRQVVKPTR